MPLNNKLTTREKKELMIKHLESNLGIVTKACRNVGIARATYYKWLNADPKFKKVAEEITEIAIDFVENKLFEEINSNNTQAIIFYLKTKAKKRGYVEKVEVEQTHTEPLQVEVMIPQKSNIQIDEG